MCNMNNYEEVIARRRKVAVIFALYSESGTDKLLLQRSLIH